MIYRNEYILTPDGYNYIKADKLPGIKPSLRLMMGIEADYPVTEKISFILSSGYSGIIISPVDSYINRHRLLINIGISMRI